MFIDQISNSKREVYRECGWKYLLNYIEKIPDEGEVADYFQFGSYIHKIFEEGYRATTYKELEDIAKLLRPRYKFGINHENKIKGCLKNFLRFNSSLADTVSTEMQFKIPLVEYGRVNNPENQINFVAIIDRIIKSKQGEYLIIDYKTGVNEKTKTDLFKDPQLMGYTYVIHKHFNVPIQKITAAHYYPVTDNLVTLKYLPGQINKWVKEVTSDVWDIRKKKKTDFSPRPNQFCNNCPKKIMCPEFVPPMIAADRILEAKKSMAEKRKNPTEKINDSNKSN